jgi:hypothetical protein
MRTEHTAADDTPTAALLREYAAKTVDALLAEICCRPIVQPEWLSLEEGAIYRGYSEQQFSDFVKRSDIDVWCAAGGPSAYSFKGDPGAVCR